MGEHPHARLCSLPADHSTGFERVSSMGGTGVCGFTVAYSKWEGRLVIGQANGHHPMEVEWYRSRSLDECRMLR